MRRGWEERREGKLQLGYDTGKRKKIKKQIK